MGLKSTPTILAFGYRSATARTARQCGMCNLVGVALTIQWPQCSPRAKINDVLDVVWDGCEDVAAVGDLQHHVVLHLLPLLLSVVVWQHVATIAIGLVAATEPITVLANARS